MWMMGSDEAPCPGRIFSPPSKETQKDHLGAMKPIYKPCFSRVWWLPCTQQMLGIQDAAEPQGAPIWSRQEPFCPQQVTFLLGRGMGAGFRAGGSPHSHHLEPSQLSMATRPSPFRRSEWSSCSLHCLHSLSTSSLPSWKTWQGSGGDNRCHASSLEFFPILAVQTDRLGNQTRFRLPSLDLWIWPIKHPTLSYSSSDELCPGN